jgi:hypothetical protein
VPKEIMLHSEHKLSNLKGALNWPPKANAKQTLSKHIIAEVISCLKIDVFGARRIAHDLFNA